ncbi:hypothetical protein SRABI106_01417 [Rahnella aquatilis]|nr:hypothetical protein SRABI106_01417 [Rahnella aquatilis]
MKEEELEKFNKLNPEAQDEAAKYLQKCWLDVGMPAALKVASQLAIDGKSEAEVIAGAVTIMKAVMQSTFAIYGPSED